MVSRRGIGKRPHAPVFGLLNWKHRPVVQQERYLVWVNVWAVRYRLSTEQHMPESFDVHLHHNRTIGGLAGMAMLVETWRRISAESPHSTCPLSLSHCQPAAVGLTRGETPFASARMLERSNPLFGTRSTMPNASRQRNVPLLIQLSLGAAGGIGRCSIAITRRAFTWGADSSLLMPMVCHTGRAHAREYLPSRTIILYCRNGRYTPLAHGASRQDSDAGGG